MHYESVSREVRGVPPAKSAFPLTPRGFGETLVPVDHEWLEGLAPFPLFAL